MTKTKFDDIKSYIERMIPDIARKTGSTQEEVIDVIQNIYDNE